MNGVRLETPRLILREHEEEDWQAVLAYASDPEVLRFRATEPAGATQVREALARIAAQRRESPRTRYEFAVTLRDTGVLIGWLPLFLTPPDLQQAEIGWTLTRAYWGRGYATEAAGAVLAFAFASLSLHRVWAQCLPENRASSRVMEKLGLRPEAYCVKSRFLGDRGWADILIYALLTDEWWAARQRATAGNEAPFGPAAPVDRG